MTSPVAGLEHNRVSLLTKPETEETPGSSAGVHLCSLVSTRLEAEVAMAALLAEGLLRGERVLYLARSQEPEEVLERLRCRGLDPVERVAAGQFDIRYAPDFYLKNGRLQGERVRADILGQARWARHEGHPRLRVGAEMDDVDASGQTYGWSEGGRSGRRWPVGGRLSYLRRSESLSGFRRGVRERAPPG